MSEAISLQNLTKYYGNRRGIDNLCLSVAEGEIFGFIGPNGAGKTTTIRTLMGLIRPTGGEARIFGSTVPAGGGALYYQVGYLPAEVNYYPEMNGQELIDYAAGFYPRVDRRWIRELMERLQFDPAVKIRAYSTGNRKKLGIIQALLHRPRLVILDEPTSGLDPLIKQELFQLLREMNALGMTVFFSTHVLEEIERICRRVALIKEGRLMHLSTLEELPGRRMKLITVEVAGGGPPRLPESWGRALPVEGHPRRYRLAVEKTAADIVEQLSRIDLEYVTITDPGIEELILAMYGTPEERDV